ncbi:excalibur calcium-binding domain-containing protein [Mannheimia varigena]|uniref:excalibur calcium-binding domain-containing protein n=1 Tax=Mannheimia varigena TaxID=85404 RepID=UPI001106D2B2|nr:excalibur calcium-binding domain-containing protein [Mannheimia varigena]MDY2946362.1 excalibur calcium-binding domain-containing protein [Mannheimia varigena]QLD33796.1 excalibur calcium-binding domain-containing protein [Mannheimia varigena]TLU74883.1 excalibur calcium-binding domain-containing protein [Mannheimia varigena]
MKKYLKFVAIFSLSFVAAVYAKEKFQCEGKRTCSQMGSCEEARFYLTQCGLQSLDRDNDGIPCESICGGKKKRK